MTFMEWLDKAWPYLVMVAGALWTAYREIDKRKSDKDSEKLKNDAESLKNQAERLKNQKTELENQKGQLEVEHQVAVAERNEMEYVLDKYRELVAKAEQNQEAAVNRLEKAQEAHQQCLEERASLMSTVEWQKKAIEDLQKATEDLRREVQEMKKGKR